MQTAFAAASAACLGELDAFGQRLQQSLVAGRPFQSFPPVRAALQETVVNSNSTVGDLLGANGPGPNLGKLNQHLMKNVLGPMEKSVDADRKALQSFMQDCR